MPRQSPITVWIDSSSKFPCKICGRNEFGCSEHPDGKTVLCHTRANPQSKFPQPPDYVNGFQFTSKFVNEGVQEQAVYYYTPERTGKRKPARDAENLTFYYPINEGRKGARTRVVYDGRSAKIVWQEYWIEDPKLTKYRTKDEKGSRWMSVSANKVRDGKATQAHRDLYLQYVEEIQKQLHLYRISESRQLAEDSKLPVFLVEGDKKVDLLIELGIPATCSIGGAGKFKHYGAGNYKFDLEGLEVVLCPDCDWAGVNHCNDAESVLGRECQWMYANPTGKHWDAVEGSYDVKDWIEELRKLGNSDESIKERTLAAIESRRDLVMPEKPEKVEQEQLDLSAAIPMQAGDDRPRLIREYEIISRHFGKRLRYNSLTNSIELDCGPINMEHLKLDLMVDHGLMLKSGDDAVLQMITKLSRKHEYNPVKSYLEAMHAEHGDNTDILQGLAERYFGTNQPIHFIYLICHLLAAVARIYEPGTKHDEALILKGDQAAGKSTFIKTLCGESWFDDSMGDYGDKDEILKLHRCWMVEWAELETVFRRKDVSKIKAFMASDKDIVRPPYARCPVEYPRRSVIWGTTNQEEFLADSTGNRRFWVVEIPAGWKVPIDLLKQERDQIWAAVTALYKHSKKEYRFKPIWTLTKEEESVSAAIAEQYQSIDTWSAQIAAYVTHKDMVGVSEILTEAIKMDLDRQDKAAQMRVSDTLKQMGWRSILKRDGAKRTRLWKRDELGDGSTSERSLPGRSIEASPESLDISRFFISRNNGNNGTKKIQKKEIFEAGQTNLIEASDRSASPEKISKFQNRLIQVDPQETDKPPEPLPGKSLSSGSTSEPSVFQIGAEIEITDSTHQHRLQQARIVAIDGINGSTRYQVQGSNFTTWTEAHQIKEFDPEEWEEF